jgi:HEAT repeat protein
MGAVGDLAAVPALVEVLSGERECWHTKTAAIRSLVALGAVEAGPEILKLLARDRDPDVREAAIVAVGELAVERARKVLERIAEDASAPHLQRVAVAALEQISRRAR